MAQTNPEPVTGVEQVRTCPTCNGSADLTADEANCLNVEVHGLPSRCPECGAMGMLWHKLGCSRDTPPTPSQESTQ